MHAGVAGVLVQIGHCGGDRAPVRLDDGLVVDFGGQGTHQQRHAFGGGEGQVEPVHAALRELPAGVAIAGDAVIEPALHDIGVGYAPVGGAPVQADQLDGKGGVAGDQPRRCAGVAFGVVLPQPAVGALAIQAVLRGLAGGVV